MKREIGLFGLGVMGKSLARNMAKSGISIALYNRHVTGSEEEVAKVFQKEHPELSSALPFDDLDSFVASLARPRKILLMVNAGPTIDTVLDVLVPLLEKGDTVMDGGNSHFQDTSRRIKKMQQHGLFFLGTGISGGEAGALNGPSIMPSGHPDAYALWRPFLEQIAAKDKNGNPCCAYIGKEGSGHFVKMIHNGIEYAEMQLIAECYAFLNAQGCSNEEIGEVFDQWMPYCGGYLLDISRKILRQKEGQHHVLDLILDRAENKGTGNWSTQAIAQYGAAATLIPHALLARYLSFFKEKRENASTHYNKPNQQSNLPTKTLMQAYQFARMINHHQGFSLIAQVAHAEAWKVDLPCIAQLWTAGCIIKSDLMEEITPLLDSTHELITHPSWIAKLNALHPSAKAMVSSVVQSEIHAPCLLEAVNFFHGYTTARLSANMIQAQRDFFGAHTYKRIDDPTGKSHHTHWE